MLKSAHVVVLVGIVSCLAACSSEAGGQGGEGARSLTSTYGNTTAVAEALPDGSFQSTLSDSSGKVLATLTWSQAAGAHVAMDGYVAAVTLPNAPNPSALNMVNDQVRELWMTSDKESVPQVCVTKGGPGAGLTCVTCASSFYDICATSCTCCWYSGRTSPQCSCIGGGC